MAGEMASFFIRLGTIFDNKGFKEAAAGIKGIESNVDALSGVLKTLGATVSAGAAIYGLISFAKSSVNAFAEQEQAVNRLKGAMQNLGSFSEGALADQVAFSSEMQRITTYTGEEILATQTLLTTYGLYGEKLKQVTRAAADLAARKGIDLHSATILLGKAFDGETGRLAQLGIHFQDTGSRARNFTGIMSEVARMTGGAAAAELDTYAGKVKSLANRWGELKESIGGLLMGPAGTIVRWAQEITAGIQNMVDPGRIQRLQDELIKTHKELAGMKKQTDFVGEAINKAMGTTTQQEVTRLENKIILLRNQLRLARADAEKPAGGPTPKAVDDRTEAERKRLADLAAANAEHLRKQTDADITQASSLIERATMTDAQIEAAHDQVLAARLTKEGQSALAKEMLDKRGAKIAADLDKQKHATAIAGITGALSFIQGAWGEHTAMYKASSIALATINTMQAYTAALASSSILGVPIAMVLAGIVLASGMAMVAKIAGVKFAHGGLALARTGGVMAQIAEGGQDEAVLPLDGRTMSRLAGAIARAGSGGLALAGGYGSIQVSQVFYMAGAAGPGAAGQEDVFTRIRIATRDGVAEALDMAKQIYRAGAALENEA